MENIELLENEIWKDIPNFTNYKLSNYARIYSKKHKRLLKTSRDQARLYIGDIKTDIPLIKLMREIFPNEEDLSKFTKVKDLLNEVWLPVKDFEEFYHISNMGRLKILDRICWKSEKEKTHTKLKHERISAMCFNDKNYPEHILIKEGVKKTRTIHRLVAQAFIPNPENKPQINHKNGIKHDNRVENLEWVTAQENSIHAYTTGLSKAKSIINDEKAKEIKNFIKNKHENGYTLKQIAYICNVSYLIVKDISRNKTWKHIII